MTVMPLGIINHDAMTVVPCMLCHALHFDQIRLAMNSVLCKCVLGTHVVLISTFPGIRSQKIISVLSYHLIGLVEIPGIEFLPLD